MAGDGADDVWVGLAETVRGVRAELTAAMEAADGERLRFEVGPVEMEFAVDVRREASADAGVRVWVLTANGKAAESAGATHRLKIVLNPKTTDGAPPYISSSEDAITPRPRG